jgi:hypothetical protein
MKKDSFRTRKQIPIYKQGLNVMVLSVKHKAQGTYISLHVGHSSTAATPLKINKIFR